MNLKRLSKINDSVENRNFKVRTVKEQFIDEDTGEVVEIEREKRTLTEEGKINLQKLLNKATNTLREKVEDLHKKVKASEAKEYEITDQILEYRNSLNDLLEQRKYLEVDMEQEVGSAEESEKDNIGNKYGELFDEIDTECDQLRANIKKLKKESYKASDLSGRLWMKEQDLEAKLDSIIKKVREQFYK